MKKEYHIQPNDKAQWVHGGYFGASWVRQEGLSINK